MNNRAAKSIRRMLKETRIELEHDGKCSTFVQVRRAYQAAKKKHKSLPWNERCVG